MPPAKRQAEPEVQDEYLPYGTLCNVVMRSGTTYSNYAFLGNVGTLLRFRANMQLSPQTELVLIPFHAIDVVGLVGQR